ncbi:hypothetical protein [Herbidospora mongoliensis]|nr:hypothetical protein [Herbidospora mongoliensis]
MNKSLKAALIAFTLTIGALTTAGAPASAAPWHFNTCPENMHWGNGECVE